MPTQSTTLRTSDLWGSVLITLDALIASSIFKQITTYLCYPNIREVAECGFFFFATKAWPSKISHNLPKHGKWRFLQIQEHELRHKNILPPETYKHCLKITLETNNLILFIRIGKRRGNHIFFHQLDMYIFSSEPEVEEFSDTCYYFLPQKKHSPTMFCSLIEGTSKENANWLWGVEHSDYCKPTHFSF